MNPLQPSNVSKRSSRVSPQLLEVHAEAEDSGALQTGREGRLSEDLAFRLNRRRSTYELSLGGA